MPKGWYEHLLSFSSSDDLKSYLLNENEQENHNCPNQHRQSATPPTSFTNFKRRRHDISKKLHTIMQCHILPSFQHSTARSTDKDNALFP